MRLLRTVGEVLYGLVIGDEWRITAAVVAALCAGAALVVAGAPAAVVVPVTAVLVAVGFTAVLAIPLLRAGPGPARGGGQEPGPTGQG